MGNVPYDQKSLTWQKNWGKQLKSASQHPQIVIYTRHFMSRRNLARGFQALHEPGLNISCSSFIFIGVMLISSNSKQESKRSKQCLKMPITDKRAVSVASHQLKRAVDNLARRCETVKLSENDAPNATKTNILYRNESLMRRVPTGGEIMTLNSRNIQSPCAHLTVFI